MEADVAIDLWTRNKLSIEDVMTATGYWTVSELFQAYLEFHEEVEMSAVRPSAEDDERRDLEELAWGLYQSLLAEEPGYLDQIIDMLRKKNKQRLITFAAPFYSAKCRSMHNVVPFRRS